MYLLLFISATGLYLWFAIRSERRVGFALLGAGAEVEGVFMARAAVHPQEDARFGALPRFGGAGGKHG